MLVEYVHLGLACRLACGARLPQPMVCASYIGYFCVHAVYGRLHEEARIALYRHVIGGGEVVVKHKPMVQCLSLVAFLLCRRHLLLGVEDKDVAQCERHLGGSWRHEELLHYGVWSELCDRSLHWSEVGRDTGKPLVEKMLLAWLAERLHHCRRELVFRLRFCECGIAKTLRTQCAATPEAGERLLTLCVLLKHEELARTDEGECQFVVDLVERHVYGEVESLVVEGYVDDVLEEVSVGYRRLFNLLFFRLCFCSAEGEHQQHCGENMSHLLSCSKNIHSLGSPIFLTHSATLRSSG